MWEKIPSFSPLSFFEISCECFYATEPPVQGEAWDLRYRLPSFSSLFSKEEKSFSDVFLFWNEGGIGVGIHAFVPFEKVEYPEFKKGDSVELFFDTRDFKEKGFLNKFCHHFVFFPEKKEGMVGKEITRFRSEDMHPLCDSRDLKGDAVFRKDSYFFSIWLPASVLHGYIPSEFPKFGFTYRIHRFQNPPQHFVVHSEEFPFERNPSSWASLKMER